MPRSGFEPSTQWSEFQHAIYLWTTVPPDILTPDDVYYVNKQNLWIQLMFDESSDAYLRQASWYEYIMSFITL